MPGGKNPPIPDRFFFDFVESFRFRVWMFSFFRAVGRDTCSQFVSQLQPREVWSYIMQFVVEAAGVADRLAIGVPAPEGGGGGGAVGAARPLPLRRGLQEMR